MEPSALSVQSGVTAPPSINHRLRARPRPAVLSTEAYVAALAAGDTGVLSRLITMTESTRPEDRRRAQEVVEAVLPRTGNSVRVGITGVPGVGKSTFIEAMGTRLADRGARLAVLAVDPSSQVTGGSILGDKSRMPMLSVHPRAYVRPSPSRGSLGGVTRQTREAILLCEACGFDTILVETVGVGQSETAVHAMTDIFLLLMLAGGGDELQGIKRGIMEMADVLTITKVDGDNVRRAEIARQEYQNALRLFPPTGTGWRPEVHLCSAATGDGLDALWAAVERCVGVLKSGGAWERRRESQALAWMRDAIEQGLRRRFEADPEVARERGRLEQAVRAGQLGPQRAAESLLDRYHREVDAS